MPPRKAGALSAHGMLLDKIYERTKTGSAQSFHPFVLDPFLKPSSLVIEDKELMQKHHMPQPPLHHAALNGEVQKVIIMAQRCGEGLINTPFNGLSPLHFALRSRCIHCVEALLEAGADANFNVDPRIMTPLRYAVEECSDVRIVELLVEFGAEPMLETLFSSPMQYVVSRLSPPDDDADLWKAMLIPFDPEAPKHPLE